MTAYKHIANFLDITDLDHHDEPTAKAVYELGGQRQQPRTGGEILEDAQKAGAAGNKALCQTLNDLHTELFNQWAEGTLKTANSGAYSVDTKGFKDQQAPLGRTAAFPAAKEVYTIN